MKRFLIPILATLAVVLTPALMVGCQGLGNEARNAATNTIALADNGFENDVRAGITLSEANDTDGSFDDAAATAIADDFFAATASKDRWQIATVAVGLFPTVQGYAEAGYGFRLNAGDLGPGVVVSKQTRDAEFERVLFQVADGAEPPSD